MTFSTALASMLYLPEIWMQNNMDICLYYGILKYHKELDNDVTVINNTSGYYSLKR